MPLSDQPSVVNQFIVDLLKGEPLLQLEDVFFGDQQLIPKTPSVAVEPGPMARELTGLPFRTDNTFTVFLIIYHSKVQGSQITRKECLEYAEAIMALLHTNKTMGDNVIHGYVTSIDPGYATRGGTLMMSTRLTWSGLSKTLT